MMLAHYSLFFLLLGAYSALTATALRFGHNPVTVDTVVLMAGRPSRLKCNYVKYRTESVREIKWYAGYTGFKSKIFEYSITTGKKVPTALSFIKVDEASATEDELTVTLTEFRDPTMTVGCEVEVVRDNGYGKLRHSKKLGESPINAVNGQDLELAIVKEDADRGLYATPGETLTVACVARGASPAPRLSFVVEGRNLTEMDGANVREIDASALLSGSSAPSRYSSSGGGVSDDKAIRATILELRDELFRGRFLTIECLAHFDDFLAAKKELALEKKESTTTSDRYSSSGRPASGYTDYGDTRRSDYGSTYDGRYGGGSGEDRGAARSSHGDRRGRVNDFSSSPSHGGGFDPARHHHPGIAYDFYSGYLLMVADNVSPSTDTSTAYVNLFGDLPYEAEEKLQREHYGRVNNIGEDRVRIKMSPVKVLNMLGEFGYRVVSASKAGSDGYLWTLEKRKFELLGRDLGGSEGYDGYRRGGGGGY